VLASLLVHANRVVPVDTLIGDVWGEDAPDKARHILHTYVSSLRKTLGDGRLQGRPPGYLLVVGPAEIDADRFDALVSEANKSMPIDPKVAIATFDDALALWRGPALADVSEQPSLLAEAARLDELRAAAQESRIEALLATGAQANALAELEPLLAGDPLRENLWGLAMLAYYRDGRQGEALNAFGRARELLADELGVDPSPELSKLHERILKQDPDLALRGEPLRGYRLLERIGSGQFGAVFRAVQPHVGRDVAVKVFHEQIAMDPGFVLRFEREAQLAAALEHPHIVPMFDYWREPGRAYLVSRYMRGGSVRALHERGGHLDRDRAVRIVEQVASALAFAHRQGAAHGAVSPSNVLFDAEGNAYLGDFTVGEGVTPDAGGDLGALAELARGLLGNEVPAALAVILDAGVGATDGPGAEAIAGVARGILEHRTVAPSRVPDERNPYKGLRAFTEADAGDFFGREELIQRLLTRLNDPVPGARFLAVVGPSGSGKSSVVRAGLVPALRRGGMPTSKQVVVADLFPGRHPLDELESAILRVATRPPTRLGDLLRDGPRGLLEAADRIAPADAELLLVVDQFEELFTLTTDERERELTLEALRVAALDPSSRLRVIVTLRADHYDRPLMYPRFGELLATRNETVPPLTADELEQAIRRPAERQETLLESGLVAEMIADVAHQPGGLPLLQYALTELFERRDGDRLTLSAYREMGGVTGALTSRADLVYTGSDAEGRRAIEQVFLRLVTLGEGRQDTRRRVAIGELDALDVSEAAVEAALEAYGHHRLLTFDHEPATREPTVEIAHESLLGAWSRLASWIDAARDDIRQNDRVRRAAAEWQGSGRDRSFLMSGSRLDQVEGWAAATRFSVGQSERAYLKASMEHRDRARRQEQARRNHEASLERRSVRRLRGLVAVFAVAALVAGSLTIVATNQGGRAEREARIASARELAAAAVANVENDQQLSVLLAIEAVERTRSVDGSVLWEAEEALHRAVTASRIVTSIPGSGDWRLFSDQIFGAIDWGPAGLVVMDGVFASDGPRPVGTVDLRDQETGEIVRSLSGHDEKRLTGAEFSPDGSMLATTGEDGRLKVWDLSSDHVITSVRRPGVARGPSFSGDGSRVAAAFGPIGVPEGVVRVVDLDTDRVRTFPAAPYTNDVALSPNGRRVVAVGGYPGEVFHLIDVETADVRKIPNPRDNGLISVAWSPDGRHIAAGGWWSSVSVMDANGRLEFLLRGHSGGAYWVDWGPDGSRLVTGSVDGTAKIWELTPRGATEVQTLFARAGSITGVAFSPDGAQVMTRSQTRVMDVWDVGPTGDGEVANIADVEELVSFLADGRHVTTSGRDGSLSILGLEDGEQVHRTIGWFEPPREPFEWHDFNPAGSAVAIMTTVGTLATTLRDVKTSATMFTARGFPLGFDWSPDGRFAAVNETEAITILDASGRQVGVLQADGFTIREGLGFGPGGLVAVPAVDKGKGEHVKIWDWRRDEIVAELHVAYDYEVVRFDADGRRIAIGNANTTIWDVQTGRLLVTLPSSQVVPNDLAFSRDDSRLAEADPDGSVHVFDTSSGEELLALRGHDDARQVAFSPDGSMLATVGDGMMRIWALDIDDLLEIARQSVTRSLTDEECRQHLHVATCPAPIPA
jgi:WD40 repeat protein/DNA-binding SARP family transcriptional activator